MPTATFDVHALIDQGSAVHLIVETSSGHYDRHVTRAKIDTPDKLAGWLLAQPLLTGGDEASFRQRLVVTWHTEQGTDTLSGEPITFKVVDTVDAQASIEDTAWTSLLSSPLATVTVAQADAAVDGITNLAEAKLYFKRVNALLINLRDINKRLLEALRDAGVR